MKPKKRYQLPYEERFINFSNFVENIIKKMLIIFITLLIISQFLLTFEEFRRVFVPLETIEGSLAMLYIAFLN